MQFTQINELRLRQRYLGGMHKFKLWQRFQRVFGCFSLPSRGRTTLADHFLLQVALIRSKIVGETKREERGRREDFFADYFVLFSKLINKS